MDFLGASGQIKYRFSITAGVLILNTAANGSGIVVGGNAAPLTAGGVFRTSAATGLTAAGTNLATCLPLTANINNVTTASAGTGVCLPPGAAGSTVTVYAPGTMLVYPQSGAASIGGSAAGASLSVAAGSNTFDSDTSTHWLKR